MGSFLRAIEELRADVREDLGHLRDDMREDNAALEARVMAALAAARDEQRQSVEAHAKLHLTDAVAQETELGRIREFMRNAELAAARRDGALGVFRFAVEQLSRHAKPITGVLVGLATVLLALSGSIHLEVAVK